jgi:hypothetical protein
VIGAGNKSTKKRSLDPSKFECPTPWCLFSSRPAFAARLAGSWAARPWLGPRRQNPLYCRLKISNIPRNQSKAVDFRRGRNERIPRFYRTSQGFTSCNRHGRGHPILRHTAIPVCRVLSLEMGSYSKYLRDGQSSARGALGFRQTYTGKLFSAATACLFEMVATRSTELNKVFVDSAPCPNKITTSPV